MPPTIQGVLIGFAVLLVVFRLLQLMRPAQERLPLLRRGFWTDLAYWGFTVPAGLVGQMLYPFRRG